MTAVRQHDAARARVNLCTDHELMEEIMEDLSTQIGDIRYGSGTLDVLRRQMVFTLEDGRKLRLTVILD